MDALVVNTSWLALLVGSGALTAFAFLRRRQRLLRQKGVDRRWEAKGHAATNGTRRHDSEVNGSLSELRRSHRRSLSDTFTWNENGVDIGAVLGVDIGGTLSKLVYFEKKPPPAAELVKPPSDDPMGKKVSMSFKDVSAWLL